MNLHFFNRFEIEDLKFHNTSVQHILWTKSDELIAIAETKKSGFNLFTLKLTNLNGSMHLAIK